MRLIPLAAALSLAAFPALAETTFSAGGTLELYHNPGGAGTPDEIDASVYGEVEANGLYLGASALKSNDATLDEFAMGLGYRGEFSDIGYDIGLTRTIADSVRVPVIASGGVGTLDDLVAGIRDGHATAVLAASIFHFGTYSIAEAKAHMAAAGIAMRLD